MTIDRRRQLTLIGLYYDSYCNFHRDFTVMTTRLDTSISCYPYNVIAGGYSFKIDIDHTGIAIGRPSECVRFLVRRG